MVTVQLQLDEEVLKLPRQRGPGAPEAVSELVRVAVGKWLVVTGASGRSR
jgi:hypothetical protein